MIEHVNSLDEAMEWFLKHASGQVLCVFKNPFTGEEISEVCPTFAEAELFYDTWDSFE